jgi:hypothetical protein
MADSEPIKGLLNVHCHGKQTHEWERVVVDITKTIWKLATQRLNGKRRPALQSVSGLLPKNSPQRTALSSGRGFCTIGSLLALCLSVRSCTLLDDAEVTGWR